VARRPARPGARACGEGSPRTVGDDQLLYRPGELVRSAELDEASGGTGGSTLPRSVPWLPTTTESTSNLWNHSSRRRPQPPCGCRAR
jgi:hypothetical protein